MREGRGREGGREGKREERKSKRTRRRLGREKRQHMRINPIHRLQHLRAPLPRALLEPIRHIAHRHIHPRRVPARLLELRLEVRDLRGERGGGEDVVEERLGAELDDARDEGGFGVRGEGGEEGGEAGLPGVAACEAELW